MTKIVLAFGLVCAFSTAALANISGYQAKSRIVAAAKAKAVVKTGPWTNHLAGKPGNVIRFFVVKSTPNPQDHLYGVLGTGRINMRTGAVKFNGGGVIEYR